MKPRNHVVLAMLKSNKRSCAHGKSFKSKRRKDKMDLNAEIGGGGF